MRVFATLVFDQALVTLSTPGWQYKGHREHALDLLECCDDLADALSSGVSGSLLDAYVTACATGTLMSATDPMTQLDRGL